MKYYAGMDVSLEGEAESPLNAICIVDETGAILKEMRAASEPETMADACPPRACRWSGSASRLAR